jgi:hypothetical protein
MIGDHHRRTAGEGNPAGQSNGRDSRHAQHARTRAAGPPHRHALPACRARARSPVLDQHRAREPALTSAVAGMVVLSGTLAGCGSTAEAGQPPSPAVASSAPVPASPAPSKTTGSFPLPAAQPAGSCPFVSQRQIAAALAQPFQHIRGCAYSFARGAGSIGVITTAYNSSAMARGCLCYAARNGEKQVIGHSDGQGWAFC